MLYLTCSERPKYIYEFAMRAIDYLGLDRLHGDLTIETYTSLDAECHGLCWGDTQQAEIALAVRSFGIKLTKKERCLALAHELVHAKQYLSGELKDLPKGRGYEVVWRGNKFKWRNNMALARQPWEAEAYRLENLIYEACN